MILQPGTTLKHGDYTIIEKLGDGGFGITYLAEQTILGRKVAIKELFLSKICTRDGNTVTVPTDGIRNEFDKQLHNFLKEARNIAKMRHSGIVPVIDMFEENGTAYYVMEYFSRGSLAQLQKSRPGGRLQESEALRYIRQIADALSYVHSKNLLHLDLKPGNILLDDNNNAILIDFGICKHYDESGNITVSTNSIETSRTPGYAPFEQYIALNLKQFSPSTDIYSLGATFYKLLTGNTPPPANERYYDDTIPPLPDEISASTRTAIEQAMRMDKRQRPQNIDEFLALLDASPTSADKSDETTKINPDDVEVTILNIAPESESTKPAPPTAPEPIEVKPEKPMEEPAKKSGVFKWVAAVTFLLLLAVAGINWWSNYQAEQAEQQRLAAIEAEKQRQYAQTHGTINGRESKDELQVIGGFNSENLYYDIATKQSRSILSSTGRGYYIIALIDPNSEPTNHFLRDVMPYKEEFEKWGQKMVLLFKDESAASRFKSDDFPNLPSTVVWGTDIDDKISNEIITKMKLKSPNRPVILVADTFNRIVFMSQGYSIGLGEQLVKVINQLSKK